MKKFKKLIYLLLWCMALCAACEKEGPVGPEGPQGEQGIQGPKGDKGDKGEPGTANVIYSGWMDITFHRTGNFWFASITAPELTQEILDNGEMSVYYDHTQSDFIYKLNYIVGDLYITQQLKVGRIRIVSSFNASNPMRYVIIPGGVAANARQTGPRPDLNNYQAVCEYYGISAFDKY